MKDTKISYEESAMLAIISGFEKRLLEETSQRKPTDRHISLDEVTTMPTFELASLALSRDAVEEVVKTMEVMRKRYINKGNVDSEVMGLFDCIEAEAYGYVSLITRNFTHQEKFYKLAMKYFDNAISRGYFKAELEKAEYQLKFGHRDAAIYNTLGVRNSAEKFAYLGECYMSFRDVTTNAIRVMEGKRPLITDKSYFDNATTYYNLGKDGSNKCKLCAGLLDIVQGNKEQGLKIVGKAYKPFKDELIQKEKIMFKRDYEAIMTILNEIENTLLKTNKR